MKKGSPEGGTMESWCRVAFTSDQVASGELLAAGSQIEQALRGAGLPRDAALFASGWTVSEKQRNEATMFLYFSPAAAAICGSLVRGLGGESCSKPPRAGLSLMQGHPSAWGLLV